MATPKFIKNISRNNLLRNFTCYLGSLYIRLIYTSGNWIIKNQNIPEELINEGKTFIRDPESKGEMPVRKGFTYDNFIKF